MTGATGAILGIRILEILKCFQVETHLVVSKWAEATIKYETQYSPVEVASLATKVHGNKDMQAPISSGSFRTDRMIIVPCSMKTLSAIRSSFGDDLVSRAADVTLKERRKLVLAVRETPLNDIHLENMLSLTRSGAIIFPPVPAFYHRPKTLDDLVQHSVGRLLDLFDIDTGEFERWDGFQKLW